MMEPDPVSSLFLSLVLLAFFIFNARNIYQGLKERTDINSYAELPSPSNVYTKMAMTGTILFFIEAVTYIVLGLTPLTNPVGSFTPQLAKPYSWITTYIGLSLVSLGVFFFLWSVVARGRYSVSWEMPEDHRLVTWGPYKYVRHPSYLGYFLMFFGLSLAWFNPVTMVPWISIPGYIHLVETEEHLLVARFGERYIRYMEGTGRFLPNIRI